MEWFFGYVFPLFRVRRSTGRRGLRIKERLIGVAGDRLIERVFSYIDLCLVS